VTYDGHAFPYYRSADDIRSQEFTHRMRGLDEDEVLAFLDLLADQTESDDTEMTQLRREIEWLRAENDRLRADNEHLRAQTTGGVQDHDSDGASSVLGHAQQVADQLVEEAVRRAGELITSAHREESEIIRQAHEKADAVLWDANEARRNGTANGYAASVAELERLRACARDARSQLRSALETLDHVERPRETSLPQGPTVGDIPQQPVETTIVWPRNLDSYSVRPALGTGE
jgi:cell division initiation protein